MYVYPHESKKMKNKSSNLWIKAFEALSFLRHQIDRETSDFIHTAVLAEYTVDKKVVEFDLRDILLVGAITESDVLLTGKTGCGKTHLANGVMNALFGQGGVFAKTILPSMNPSEFMDIDFPAILNGSKTMQEAVSGINSFLKPGVVLNEVNRAPGVIQSLLIPFLDRELEVQGVPVTMGKKWKKGRYQYRILTINEGGSYQVQAIDPAIRDRMTIEVPVNNFPQTGQDVISMLSKKNHKYPICYENFKQNFNTVTWLKTTIESVITPKPIIMFFRYLSGLSYCIRAPQGTKESVELTPDLCDGCHHLAMFYNICGNILAPSPRILIKLNKVAKAFALLRYLKTGTENPIFVHIEDVLEAAPFVFYSKLNLNPYWLNNAGSDGMLFYGDKWTAIREIMSWIYKDKFIPLQRQGTLLWDLLWEDEMKHKITHKHYERMYDYLLNDDPWAYNPAEIRLNIKALTARSEL